MIEGLREMGVDYAQGYGVCKPSPLFAVAAVRAMADAHAMAA